MLEIPAVAFAMPELCRDADFFSIGTNDLAQYFFAADRDNPKVAPMHSPAHPAFLRLLKQLVVQAHAQNRWVGLCGGMAEIPALLPILLGLGLDEISLSIPRLGPTKGAIRQLPDAACRVVLNQALSSATEAEVGRCLQAFRAGPGGMPLLIPQLVMLDSDARTKGEVIRELVHALQLESRTSQPDLVEEEIWLREESYSTGFGRGFAIPHCQSEHLSANTLAVLKTREPIGWGSLDNQPVRNVLLLAIRKDQADREHLKVLARLSRLLMRDEFQDRLRTETNSESLAVFIQESIYE
jgi:fructose-specific PTS system IIA-like component